MTNTIRTIFVYLSLDKEYYIGKIFIQNEKGICVAFEYSDEYFNSETPKIDIDPDISSYRGRQFPSLDRNFFGFLSDCSPDMWGKTLLQRKEVELAAKSLSKPRKLNNIDYLLGVFDKTRMGALRFKENPDGCYLSNDFDYSIPPWISLRKLEKYAVDFDEGVDIDDEWTKNLLVPGSSLGGTRPKANVYSPDGTLWIAKFPSRKDTYDVGAWEYVANSLAKKCGLDVSEFKLETFSKFGSTFLVKRFDRDKERRIHFQSAMTALGAVDGSSSEYSYLHLADVIKAKSSKPKDDLKELYKRIVFNMAISNTDDHLRNHGFLYINKGYQLSPVYDINPCPYGKNLSLNISLHDSRIDPQVLLNTHKYYDLSKDEAISLYNNIVNIVNANWKKEAENINISKKSIELMKTAFFLKPIEE